MWNDILVSVAEVVAAGVLAYIWVVMVLRVSGKRTLAKLNAFDFIVTVALGSTLASIMLSDDVTFFQGAAAFTTLALLQWVVARVTLRVDWAMKTVRSSPRLLLLRGEMLKDAMREERIAESDIRAVARNKGQGSLKELFAIVFETDGTFSVIKDEGDHSAMKDVVGYDANA